MTADVSRISRLTALLLDARAEGRTIAQVPDDLVPADEAEAYRVQALTASRIGRIAGWKVGAARPARRPPARPCSNP
jgi:2-keto-4-pentenoate hydratase